MIEFTFIQVKEGGKCLRNLGLDWVCVNFVKLSLGCVWR